MKNYNAKTTEGKCPFCEIAAQHIQARTFWEDSEFMAFLAIDPNTEGFSCVIPKKHFGSDVLKMPNDVLSNLVIAAKTVSEILENYYKDVGRVGLIMEGTGIDHAHIKLVPLHGTENLKSGIWKQVLSEKEFWFNKYEGWISSGSGPMADREKLTELAENLKRSQK
ncbi:MAG TPA: HIT family protein [Candidatus Paceibacterota bacterium]